MSSVLSNQGYLVKKTDLTPDQIDLIKTQLKIKPIVIPTFKGLGGAPDPEFNIYLESPNYYYLPRQWGIANLGTPARNRLTRGDDLPTEIQCRLRLFPHQEMPYEKTVSHLDKYGGAITSIPCGEGKTMLSLYIALTNIRGKCVIVIPRECLIDQWTKAIQTATGGKARVGVIQGPRRELDCDFVIAMVQTLCCQDFKPADFSSFRMTIFDECHVLGSRTYSQVFYKLGTRYTLGLSATPIRKDGTNLVLYAHIGDICVRKRRTGHNQVLIKTLNIDGGVLYRNEYRRDGCVDSVKILSNLGQCLPRTRMVVDIIRCLLKEDRKIILLSGRRQALTDLDRLLGDAHLCRFDGTPATWGYYVGHTEGSKKSHKETLETSAKSDIILATYQVAGVGLDIPELNTEILLTPMSDVEQATGRILRKYHENVNPLIVDLVDHVGNFAKQGKTREGYYKFEGYVIEHHKVCLPDWSDLENFLLSRPGSDPIPAVTGEDNAEDEADGGPDECTL